MSILPKIRIQGWHNDGPVYQVERDLSGRRNRHARRAGLEAFEQIGKPGGRNLEKPAAHIVAQDDAHELWAFNVGHVYAATQTLDDEEQIVLIDAREDYALHTAGVGVEVLDYRALDEDEIAELEDDSPADDESDADEQIDPEQSDDVDAQLDDSGSSQEGADEGDDEDAVSDDDGKSDDSEE